VTEPRRDCGSDKSAVETTGSSHVPWMRALLDDVERLDEGSVLSSSTMIWLMRMLIALPPATSRPEVDVGEDGAVSLAWTRGSLDVEVCVSNRPDENVVFVDRGQGLIGIPLTPDVVAGALSRIFRWSE
jgi:hypothetical protein